MSLRQLQKANDSHPRKTTLRQQKLPSGLPFPRPTRDVSASNKSHSIVHEEYFIAGSERKIMDREAEQHEYEKQANIVYTRQFRLLAKLLGKQNMEFDELKDKVEQLLEKDRPDSHEQELKLRIHTLQRQLAKKDTLKTSQLINSQNQYTKQIEFQLDRKSKLISELSNSIKREDFELAYRGLEKEVSQKEKTLRSIEDQLQEAKVKSNSQITQLEEEIIKRNQTIQKLTFQLDTLKRKNQSNSEETERLRKREKDLLTSLETETKVSYQGITYSLNSLQLQLQSRDKELSHCLQLQEKYEQQLSRAKEIFQQDEMQKRNLEASIQQLQANINYYKASIERQNLEVQQHKDEKESLRQEKMSLQHKVDSATAIITQMEQQEQSRLGEMQILQNKNEQLAQNYHSLYTQYQQLQLNSHALQQQHQQLDTLLKEEKDNHSATLHNFETIHQKMLQENQARHKLQALLAEKQENIQSINLSHQQQLKQQEQKEETMLLQCSNLRQLLRQTKIQLQMMSTRSDRLEAELQSERKQKIQLINNVQHLQEQSSNLKQALDEINLELVNNKLNLSNLQLSQVILKEEITRLTTELEDTKSLKTRQTTIILETQSLLQTYQNQKQQLEHNNHQLQQQLEHLHQTVRQQAGAITAYKSRDCLLQEYETKIKLLEGQSQIDKMQSKQHIEALSLQIQSNKQQISELNFKMFELISQIERIPALQSELKQKQQLSNELEILSEQLNQSKIQIEQYQNIVHNLQGQIQNFKTIDQEAYLLKKQLDEQTQVILHYESQLPLLEQYKTKIDALEQQLSHHQAEQHKLETTMQEMVEKEKHLQSELQNYHQEILELRTQKEEEAARNQKERQENYHKIQILNQHVENQRERIAEQQRLRVEVERELNQLHNRIKILEQKQIAVETQLKEWKQKAQLLQHELTQKQVDLQNLQGTHEQEQLHLKSQIKALSQEKQNTERDAKARNIHIVQENTREIQQREALITQMREEISSLQQEKQYLSAMVSELTAEKENYLSSHSESKPANQLVNCSFSYYESQKMNANQNPRVLQSRQDYQKQQLIRRIEQLQRQVDDLRQELEDKSQNTLVYSMSKEEQSLKLINSLQLQKQQVELAMRELQDILPRLQTQNNLLKQKLQKLTKQMEIRQKYNNLVAEHEIRYAQLSQHIVRMEEQMGRIKSQQQNEHQNHTSQSASYQQQIQQLRLQLSQTKSKEMELTNQVVDSQILRSEIHVLSEQIKVFRQQCEERRTLIQQLQNKNALLQQQNAQLQNHIQGMLVQNNRQEKRDKQSLSRKSVNSSSISKKDIENDNQPSELSQKILNYDPSKISGQDSKFANLVFESSKIKIIRQAVPDPQSSLDVEIKEQRNEESILSKNVQQKEKSVSQPHEIYQKRHSESSRRQVVVQREQIKKQIDKHTLKDDISSVCSKHSQSIINKMRESNHSIKTIENKKKKIEASEIKIEPKKQEYLPQQSSHKKALDPHLRQPQKVKPLIKQQQNHMFSKKIQMAAVSPIYVSRESVIHSRNDGSREENSKSRSSSKNKVTITYGQGSSDRSLQLKKEDSIKLKQSQSSLKIFNNMVRQPEFSIRESNFGTQIQGERSIIQTSPANHREAIARHQDTIRNSIYSSRLRPSILKQNPLKSSIIQKDKVIQSQSIIHGVTNFMSNQSLPQPTNNFKPSPFRSNPSHYCYQVEHQIKNYPMKNQLPPMNAFSPKNSGLNFHTVRSSNQLNPLNSTVVNNYVNPVPPSQLTRTIQFVKQEFKVGSPAEKTIEATPLKVSMKRVASGYRNTSAANETATFGPISSHLSNESLSMTQDSGIEVFQYDWTAPCCEMQP